MNKLLRGIVKALNPVPAMSRGWRIINEPFTGAWQRNMEEKRGDVLCYPTLYACIMRIATDIGKLPFMLMRRDENGIWTQTTNAAYSPVLNKPNHYQTSQQFREAWMLSKLLQGNTYVLKERDDRGVVRRMYVLNPHRVQPLVSESGDVYYELQTDDLNMLPEGRESMVVPAREIIHDRCVTLHHPLIGVPPLCAAHWPAVKNLKILRNSAEFFGNGARPGGILMAPAGIKDTDAEKLKNYWDQNFTGNNAGKVAVLGADLKYQQLAENAADSQMVEQMRYSDEQICQPFGIHPFKVGIGAIPAGMKVDELNVMYMQDALQTHIDAMETLLEQGMRVELPLEIWLDEDQLIRMDVGKQADVETKLVGKIKTPDESRKRFNLAPTGGGDTLWGQHQDYPLEDLRNRAEWDPALRPDPEPALTEEPDDMDEEVRQFTATLIKGLSE